MNDCVLDASVALQWFREDESGREYGLAVLKMLSDNHAIVPTLWFYELGNSLVMAHRRKRITAEHMDGFVSRLMQLPIEVAGQTPTQLFELPAFARVHGLTNYDAAYLSLSLRLKLPLATTDGNLRRATAAAGADLVAI